MTTATTPITDETTPLTETIRTETVRTETIPTETTRAGTARTETARTETAHTETTHTETTRTETARTETARLETTRAESMTWFLKTPIERTTVGRVTMTPGTTEVTAPSIVIPLEAIANPAGDQTRVGIVLLTPVRPGFTPSRTTVAAPLIAATAKRTGAVWNRQTGFRRRVRLPSIR